MPTNLAIDDLRTREAKKLGRLRTKKDALNDALDEYVLSADPDFERCAKVLGARLHQFES